MRSVAAKIWRQASQGDVVSLFKSHREGYADGGQLRDFIYVRDAADVVSWLITRPDVSGIFNLGSGKARSFKDLAEALFQAAGQTPRIAYHEMPEGLRAQYQYYTEADVSRLFAAGYPGAMTNLDDGVGDYVRSYLATDDPYR